MTHLKKQILQIVKKQNKAFTNYVDIDDLYRKFNATKEVDDAVKELFSENEIYESRPSKLRYLG